MERCAVCGAEEFIPYVCRYCGRTHCVYHRLPENHECPNINQARAPKPIIRVERRSTGTNLRLIRAPKLSSISSRELYALSAAFIFAAPGAVYIASRSSYFGEGIDRKANGVISLVGPMVNIAASAIFAIALAGSTALGFGDLVIGNAFHFLRVGVQINIWLGAFN